ncbi:phage holin family protein [Arthrobacter sp. 35W]|uniref:phage holin family protein n=1 Tax=Arthrobacter sp. 35W TaxID=1132441 RepID=UPI00041A165B|nr:phage holin family protein [Arthrobacter sp. 35W]
MGYFIARVLINAVALWLVTVILPGVDMIDSGTSGLEMGTSTLGTALGFVFVGLVFGIINALVKPIVSLLSLPVTILTLGLFTVVINAGMLWMTSWLTSYTPVHFSIDEFWWTAVWAALLMSLFSMIANALTGINRR